MGNLTFEQQRHEPTDLVGTKAHTRAYTSDFMGRLKHWAQGSLSNSSPVAETVEQPHLLPIEVSNAEQWTLDDVGNWTQHVSSPTGGTQQTTGYAPNSLNQFATVTPSGGAAETLTYDWLGNLREDPTHYPTDKRKLVWDAFGRLTQVWRVESGGAEHKQAEYRYDALNRRVYSWGSSTDQRSDAVLHYIWDGWQNIEERAVVGATEVVRARYGYGVGLDEVLWMDRDTSPTWTSPDGTIDTRYFVHRDLLGSTTAVTLDRATETALSVIERMVYSAYGKTEVYTGAWQVDPVDEKGAYAGIAEGQSSIGLPFLYTGQRLDPETGLYFYKHRVYDPDLGRFLSRDPLGYGDGPNLYRYASAMPNRAVDPLGLRSEPPLGTPSRGGWWSQDARSNPGSASSSSIAFSSMPSGLNLASASAIGGVIGPSGWFPGPETPGLGWDPSQYWRIIEVERAMAQRAARDAKRERRKARRQKKREEREERKQERQEARRSKRSGPRGAGQVHSVAAAEMVARSNGDYWTEAKQGIWGDLPFSESERAFLLSVGEAQDNLHAQGKNNYEYYVIYDNDYERIAWYAVDMNLRIEVGDGYDYASNILVSEIESAAAVVHFHYTDASFPDEYEHWPSRADQKHVRHNPGIENWIGTSSGLTWYGEWDVTVYYPYSHTEIVTLP